MNKIVSAGLVVISLVLGIFIGYKIKKPTTVSGGQDTYQAGWDAAKKKLSESGFVPPVTEVKAIRGQVTGINGDKVTLKINSVEPLADPSLDTRVIDITSNTKIFEMINKDPEVYQKEMADFQKSMQDNGGKPTGNAPMPFDKKEVDKSAISKDKNIIVMTDSNIKDSPEFTATEIDIQVPMPSVPTPMPSADTPAPTTSAAPAN